MTVRRLLFKEKIWIPLVRAIKLHKGFLWFPIDPKLQPNWSRRLKRVRSIPDHRWKVEVPLFQEKIVLFHQSVNLNVFEVINFFCNRFERIFYSPSCLSEKYGGHLVGGIWLFCVLLANMMNKREISPWLVHWNTKRTTKLSETTILVTWNIDFVMIFWRIPSPRISLFMHFSLV